MKKYELTSVSSPSVEFECNGQLCTSEALKNTKKNPNFSNPALPRMIVVSNTVHLPREGFLCASLCWKLQQCSKYIKCNY